MGEWTSTLDGGEWPASRRGLFTPGKTANSTHCRGGWVGPRAGLDAVKWRKTSCRESNPGRPVPSSSLHQLSNPGFLDVLGPPLFVYIHYSRHGVHSVLYYVYIYLYLYYSTVLVIKQTTCICCHN
jgi:hypothetical protein